MRSLTLNLPAAQPVLEALAESTAMASFLVIRDHEEAVTVAVVEPRSTVAHVMHHPGKRNPITRGAPGLALLAAGIPADPDTDAKRSEIDQCRQRGWAYSQSEVLAGMKSIASPVVDRDGGCRAAVALVFVGEHDLSALGGRVAEPPHRPPLSRPRALPTHEARTLQGLEQWVVSQSASPR